MTPQRSAYLQAMTRAGMSEDEAIQSMMEFFFSPEPTEDEVDLGELYCSSTVGCLEHCFEWQDTRIV